MFEFDKLVREDEVRWCDSIRLRNVGGCGLDLTAVKKCRSCACEGRRILRVKRDSGRGVPRSWTGGWRLT